jgi:hypothetical protein
MIREDKFLISHRPYAINMSALQQGDVRQRWDGVAVATYKAPAVWFRRHGKSGYADGEWQRTAYTVACVGEVSGTLSEPFPVTPEEVLAGFDDGRYGGDCQGRWDGERYWGSSQLPEVMAVHLELLRPMLDNYPAVPDSYDGWWRF